MNLPENPLVKGLIWFVGIAVSISVTTTGVIAFADGRYHHRFPEDMYQRQAEALQVAAATDQKLDALRLQVEWSADNNAKRAIEGELFKLEQIPPQRLTPADRAIYEKLKRDRRELVDRWNRIGRPLR